MPPLLLRDRLLQAGLADVSCLTHFQHLGGPHHNADFTYTASHNDFSKPLVLTGPLLRNFSPTSCLASITIWKYHGPFNPHDIASYSYRLGWILAPLKLHCLQVCLLLLYGNRKSPWSFSFHKLGVSMGEVLP